MQGSLRRGKSLNNTTRHGSSGGALSVEIRAEAARRSRAAQPVDDRGYASFIMDCRIDFVQVTAFCVIGVSVDVSRVLGIAAIIHETHAHTAPPTAEESQTTRIFVAPPRSDRIPLAFRRSGRRAASRRAPVETGTSGACGRSARVFLDGTPQRLGERTRSPEGGGRNLPRGGLAKLGVRLPSRRPALFVAPEPAVAAPSGSRPRRSPTSDVGETEKRVISWPPIGCRGSPPHRPHYGPQHTPTVARLMTSSRAPPRSAVCRAPAAPSGVAGQGAPGHQPRARRPCAGRCAGGAMRAAGGKMKARGAGHFGRGGASRDGERSGGRCCADA